MIDPKILRNDIDAVVAGLARRGFDFPLQQYQSLEQQRRSVDSQRQELRRQRNDAARQIGVLVKSGVAVEEAKSRVAATMDSLGGSLAHLDGESEQLQQDLQQLLYGLPNLPAEQTPNGRDESENLEIDRWGSPRDFSFEARDHLQLGAGGGIDPQAGVRLAGSRFVVLSGDFARLHRALLSFMIDLHTEKHGYREYWLPCIANEAALLGTGQLPKFGADLFRLHGEAGYYLIPTGEVPLTNLYSDTVLATEALEQPLRLAAATPCFRREAGSYGRDTRGILRQHQFDKVELVQLVRPDDSERALEELTGHAEAVLQQLGLPYRKVALCAGDLGFAARRTYDLEVWMPASERYREISSCSDFGDFQARRLKLRWRNPNSSKPEHPHTLNGSGVAVGRCLAAIVENGQCEDGSIDIPEVLLPYMGGRQRILPQA